MYSNIKGEFLGEKKFRPTISPGDIHKALQTFKIEGARGVQDVLDRLTLGIAIQPAI